MNWTAPAGVPWLVWIILVVLFGPPALASKAAARIPGVLGFTGRWWQARRIRVVAEGDLERMERELHELRADYDREVPTLTERVNSLEAQLSTAMRQLWAAVDYVRTLTGMLRRHAPGVPIPDPPEDLHDVL